MTDEELKFLLCSTKPVTPWWADHAINCPRNPEGLQAVRRIEELEAKIFQMDPQCAKNDPLINGGTNDDG
tara:strand:+ start:1057 stop:1266 length:210 start_codon:yes stop_codon:yes gene_type:complete